MWTCLVPKKQHCPAGMKHRFPMHGEVFLACCYILHQQTGQLGTVWPFWSSGEEE